MEEPSNRTLALALGVLGLLTRLPFQSRMLYHWDSVNFALATRHFDISPQFEQPQPPGYILYVGLAKAVDYLIRDPQTTLVWISILASGLAVVLLFYLGLEMFNRATAIVAALLLSTNPLFWFYGEIALPHALDMALVIASVLLLYQALTRAPRALILAAVVLAIAGGVRPQTLVFLGPLYLFAAWRVGFRISIPATVVLILGCSLWLLPLLWITGGPVRYSQILADFSLVFDRPTSVFLGAGLGGLLSNSDKLLRYTLYGLGLAILPLAIGALARLRGQLMTRADQRALIVGLWILPCLIFYLLIMMGQQGLIFVYLPALLLLSAAFLAKLASGPRTEGLGKGLGKGSSERGRFLSAGFLAVALVFNLWLFLLAPEYLAGRTDLKVLNWSTIQDSDSHFGSFVSQVRARQSPANTVIFTANWRHVEYYLPEYMTWHTPLATDDTVYRFHPTGAQAEMPELKLLLFDSFSTNWAKSDLGPSLLPETAPLAQITLHRGQVFVYSHKGIQVEESASK